MQLRNNILTITSSILLIVLFGCGTGTAKPTNDIPAAITSISITPPSANVSLRQTAQLRAIASYTDGTTKDISAEATWTSNSLSIAALNSHGLITCDKAGGAHISATEQSMVATASVTCSAPSVTGLSLEATPAIIRSDSPFQYQLTATYTDGTTDDVTSNAVWTTDPSIAAIYPYGLVVCNNSGAATVSASFSGMTSQASFKCILHPISPRPGFAESAKTFDGPFTSWVNIKSAFGAKGDGVTDDSNAFQAALDSLAKHPAVLWIPHGTYLIDRPLNITGVANISIIGENPLTTTLSWVGPSGGTMLTLSGCMGFNIGRLTWDGRSLAASVLNVTWDDRSNYYPTRNYIHDSRIINTAIGIRTGWAGETTVDRVHFDHNTQAGISLGDWNALNFNVVDSLFTDDAIGVTNIYGAGAFNVSNSVFVRSSSSDMEIGNTGPFSFRNNLSVDSKMFLQTGMTGAPANIIIQGNTIYHPASTPIASGTPGSLMILDNTFLDLDPSLHLLTSFCASPLKFLSIGNTYSVTKPFSGYLGDYRSIDEESQPVDPPLAWAVPTEIYVPPLSHRKIFDLPSGSSNAAIQTAIDDAVAVEGIVHLPKGNYNIVQTLLIPSNSDIGIVGDGALTSLNPGPGLEGPVLQSHGSVIQLENIELSGNRTSPAIELHIPDRPSTRILCDECALNGGGSPGLEIDGLDNADIEFKVATLNADSGSLAATVHGGVTRDAGTATLGTVGEFMTGSSQYRVDHGGHLLLEDGWHDVGQGLSQFLLSGSGSVTQEGGTIYASATEPAMILDDYKGSLSLLGEATNSYLDVSTGSSSTVFIAGILQTSGESPVAGLEPSSSVSGIYNSSTPDNSVPSGLPDSLVSDNYIEHMMAMARTQVLSPRITTRLDSVAVEMTRIIANGFGLRIIGNPISSSNGNYFIVADGATGVALQACGPEEIDMAGTWILQDGKDGFLGLSKSGFILSEGLTAHDNGNGAVMVNEMSSARDRWLFRQVGDGSFEIINRATGDAITEAPSGCAYIAKDRQEASQHWRINNAN